MVSEVLSNAYGAIFVLDIFCYTQPLGQFYTVTMHDTEEYDGDIHSVIRVTFHEEPHRKLAARYWSFWLSQQTNPKTARALDIGMSILETGMRKGRTSTALSDHSIHIVSYALQQRKPLPQE